MRVVARSHASHFLSWLFVFWKMQTIYWSYCSSCRLDTAVINDTGNICGFCRAVGVRGNIKVTWVHWVSEHNRWDRVLDLPLYVGNQTVSSRPKETSRLSKEYFLTLGDILGLYRNVGFVLYIFTEKKKKKEYNKGINSCRSLNGDNIGGWVFLQTHSSEGLPLCRGVSVRIFLVCAVLTHLC